VLLFLWLVLFFIWVLLAVGFAFAVFTMVVQQFLGCCWEMN
jgi:hypothetical protein